jgi:hypothetical protein
VDVGLAGLPGAFGFPLFGAKGATAPNGNIRCSVWSGFVVLSQSYHYFSPGVALFQIPNRLGDFTQRVTSVDHRG